LSESGTELSDDAGGRVRSQMSRLLPAHAIGDAKQESSRIHVAGTGGVDGRDRYSFDRDCLAVVHQE
jgi:hypothetical protein